eukprot:1149040-Rhodomonas_salina.2
MNSYAPSAFAAARYMLPAALSFSSLHFVSPSHLLRVLRRKSAPCSFASAAFVASMCEDADVGGSLRSLVLQPAMPCPHPARIPQNVSPERRTAQTKACDVIAATRQIVIAATRQIETIIVDGAHLLPAGDSPSAAARTRDERRTRLSRAAAGTGAHAPSEPRALRSSGIGRYGMSVLGMHSPAVPAGKAAEIKGKQRKFWYKQHGDRKGMPLISQESRAESTGGLTRRVHARRSAGRAPGSTIR